MKIQFNKMLAFKAMTEVMRIGLMRKDAVNAIACAMNDGLVTTTLAFHRELVAVESELSHAIMICRRTAGDENTQKVMSALEAAG